MFYLKAVIHAELTYSIKKLLRPVKHTFSENYYRFFSIRITISKFINNLFNASEPSFEILDHYSSVFKLMAVLDIFCFSEYYWLSHEKIVLDLVVLFLYEPVKLEFLLTECGKSGLSNGYPKT